jgi:hypothetical protein
MVRTLLREGMKWPAACSHVVLEENGWSPAQIYLAWHSHGVLQRKETRLKGDQLV